jgi:NAD(P)-dependent dehydrogenase (short-subunit alcohol dehydrogenase family)
MKLKNKVVLVTGGSRGIGKAIAKKFAENGAQIVITSKNKNRLKNTEKEIKNCFSVAGDVRNDKDVKNVIDKTVKKFKKIDVLVNNVGVLPEMKKLHKISEKEWIEMIDLNLNAHFRFSKYAIQNMQKNGGSIINIASDSGLKPFENFYADGYSAAKAAMIHLTKIWALEYAKYNVRVNCISAAVVDTDMTKSFWLDTKKKKELTIKQHPLRRIGKPIDIANAALYFASDDSSWTTGAILPVDGGVSIK